MGSIACLPDVFIKHMSMMRQVMHFVLGKKRKGEDSAFRYLYIG